MWGGGFFDENVAGPTAVGIPCPRDFAVALRRAVNLENIRRTATSTEKSSIVTDAMNPQTHFDEMKEAIAGLKK